MSRERLYIGPARSMEEACAAQSLAVKVFAAITNKDSEETARFKALVWQDHAGLDPQTVIVVSIGSGNVVATTRVVPRTMYRADKPLRAAGISSVCVDEEFRGKGLSRPLMEQALAVATDRDFDLAFLNARRAFDHYYTRFGFHGLASYPQIGVKVADLSVAADIKIELAELDDIKSCNTYYEANYGDCFGRFERNEASWRHIRDRMSFVGSPVRMLRHKGSTCGYVVVDAGQIEEFAFAFDANPAELLGTAARLLGVKESLVLHVPPQHRALRQLVAGGGDVKFAWRQCPYGGHMVRILNEKRLQNALVLRATGRAQELGLSAHAEKYGPLEVRWDGAAATLSLSEMAKAPLGLETTRALLGAASPFHESGILNEMLPLHVSLPDHV